MDNMPKMQNMQDIPNMPAMQIPLLVLRDRGLSVLEAIVEYLKDEKRLTYQEIALMLNRNDRTVWTCYNRAKEKRRK